MMARLASTRGAMAMKETISLRRAPLDDLGATAAEDDLEEVAAEAVPVAALAPDLIVRAEMVVPEMVCSGMADPLTVVAGTVVAWMVMAAIVVGAVAVTERSFPTVLCAMGLPTPVAVYCGGTSMVAVLGFPL